MTDLRARVWALIADEPAGDPTLGVTEAYLHRLCQAAVTAVPVSGAALSVTVADGTRSLTIASDRTSQLMAELQVTLGEGPSVDVHALRRPVLKESLSDAALARWPTFVPAAVVAGVRAVYAFPLQIGAARLGVLDLHRETSGSLSQEALGLALAFADVAVLTLLDGNAGLDGGSHMFGLEQAIDDQAELYQAQGMLKVQLGVSLSEAMARLRAYAYASDQRLADVAREVVARRLLIDRDLP